MTRKDGTQFPKNDARTINTHSAVDDDELIFEEEDTTANTHEVIAKNTESEVKVHALKDTTVRKKKKVKAPRAPIANKEKKPAPISINLSRIMSEPKRENASKTEVNMALRSNLTPIAEEREIHMMRTFHGIKSDDEEEAEENPYKNMSLIERVTARHFAEKKATQEAKVKKEEDVVVENFKLENVMSDTKQEGRMLTFRGTCVGKTTTCSCTGHLRFGRF